MPSSVTLSAPDRMLLWLLLDRCPKQGLADHRLCEAIWSALRLDEIVQEGNSLRLDGNAPLTVTVENAHVARIVQAVEHVALGVRGVPALLAKLQAAVTG